VGHREEIEIQRHCAASPSLQNLLNMKTSRQGRQIQMTDSRMLVAKVPGSTNQSFGLSGEEIFINGREGMWARTMQRRKDLSSLNL
jgi:hypothetical protein